jgi:hypothetical protein
MGFLTGKFYEYLKKIANLQAASKLDMQETKREEPDFEVYD